MPTARYNSKRTTNLQSACIKFSTHTAPPICIADVQPVVVNDHLRPVCTQLLESGCATKPVVSAWHCAAVKHGLGDAHDMSRDMHAAVPIV